MSGEAGTGAPRVHAANRLGLDYEAEARRFPPPAGGIIDVHTHINGPAAAAVHRRAASLYGVRLIYSMTPLEKAGAVRDVLGDSVRFIAVPDYSAKDRLHHHGPEFVRRIERFAALGARVVKFWAAPRGIDYGREAGDPALLRLDSPQRIAAMEAAAALGMVFMTHVADPDTWFATKYADASAYGTKAAQYEPLEALLERFPVPWIAAHMGGWPEDLEFLAELMARHDNLYLDTSAAKWMVRELSRHRRDDLVAFLRRFPRRVLFGSDTVAADEHLRGGAKEHEVLGRAASLEEAFDLYASRYWAFRTLLESDYDGPSPIADPDLAMLDPGRYGEMDAPALRGKSLERDLLEDLYSGAARALLDPLHH